MIPYVCPIARRLMKAIAKTNKDELNDARFRYNYHRAKCKLCARLARDEQRRANKLSTGGTGGT